MRYLLFLFFGVTTLMSYSQEFVVEKVLLTETVENKYVSEIPKLKDLSSDSNQVAEVVNSSILDRFMITGFVQSELEEFNWFEVRFSSEIKENILYISFTGEYYGAYLNSISEEMFFDLNTGAPLKLTFIPFEALFTLSGYSDFLNKYWIEGVKIEFEKAIKCAGMEPYCDLYDISRFTVDSNMLSISLTDDCYPHVVEGCSPVYEIAVELDSIKPYLNNLGKYILIESTYMKLSPIEKFLKNQYLLKNLDSFN